MANFGNKSPFNSSWNDLGPQQRDNLKNIGISEKTWNSWNKSAQQTTKTSNQVETNMMEGQSKIQSKLTENLSLWTAIVTAQREGNTEQNTQNALFDIAEAALNREQKIRTNVVQKLGQVGELQQMQNKNIMQASIEAQRYGLELDDVIDTTVSLSQALGRNVFVSDEDIARVGIFSKSVGLAAGQAAQMVKYFDQAGLSVGEAIDKGNEMANVARQMGVNVGDFMETISGNMQMMNLYNFADGVKGFAKMAAQSQKLGLSMTRTAEIAETLMDPEGAIEMAANLQVVGGAVGDLADPFKMMYMATNDLAGLQDALVQAGGELAMFNEETGEVSFPPTAQRQLREMAKAIGIPKEEFAQMIKLQTKFKSMQNQFSFELEGREDMQEFVTSMASLNQETGKFEIKVPGLDDAVELEDLTSKQLDKLKEVQDQQQMTEKELMAEQTGILNSIEYNTKALNTALLAGVAEGIDASKISTDISQALSKAFSSGELNKISEGFGGLITSGIENIFGTEMGNFSGMIKDGATVFQALLGTGMSGTGDLLNIMTEASKKDFKVQQGQFFINEVKGKNVNDFTLDPGNAKAVLKSDGEFLLPSVNDTVSGVDLTAGAKGANLGSLVSNTGSIPEKTIKLEFTGMPSRIPIELNGKNMGDFNWRGLLGNNLFMQNLKAMLIATNLATAPGYNNEQENEMGGIQGQGNFT